MNSLLDLVSKLLDMADDELAQEVVKNGDVKWCLSELYDILEAEKKGEIDLTPNNGTNPLAGGLREKDRNMQNGDYLKLRECPFCGGDGAITVSNADNSIYCTCWVCGAQGQPFQYDGTRTYRENYLKAIRAWNARTKEIKDDGGR